MLGFLLCIETHSRQLRETRRTPWKDMCKVEVVDPQSPQRKVTGHFWFSRFFSVCSGLSVSVSPSLPLLPLFLCLLVSVSQLLYAHLFKSPSFLPNWFFSPSQLQPAPGLAVLWSWLNPRETRHQLPPCLSFPITEGSLWSWDLTICQSFAFCFWIICHRRLPAR